MATKRKLTVPQPPKYPDRSKYVALDCEFVGVGRNRNALGRVSMVSIEGKVLLDLHSKPTEKVTRLRTRTSGITAADMSTALAFPIVRRIVKRLLQGRILVGHSVNCDLEMLDLRHPEKDTRDTAMYVPLRRKANLPLNLQPSLKNLAFILLRRNIQTGAHSSVKDARASMDLYRQVRDDWEFQLHHNSGPRAKRRRV